MTPGTVTSIDTDQLRRCQKRQGAEAVLAAAVVRKPRERWRSRSSIAATRVGPTRSAGHLLHAAQDKQGLRYVCLDGGMQRAARCRQRHLDALPPSRRYHRIDHPQVDDVDAQLRIVDGPRAAMTSEAG